MNGICVRKSSNLRESDSVNSSVFDHIPRKVCAAHTEILPRTYMVTEAEIVVFQLGSLKAPGLDGFPA